MKRLLILFFVLANLSIVSGCGQSGPLYLPGNPSEIKTPQQVPADQEQKDKKSEEEDGQ